MASMYSLEDVGKHLRRILISSPVKLKVFELNQRYRDLIGRNIPFEEHGFNDLIDFLKIFPDIINVDRNNLFSAVSVPKKKKKRNKKNKKKAKEIAQNQIALRTNQTGYTGGVVSISQSGTTRSISIIGNNANTMRLNIDMNVDFKRQNIQFDAKIDSDNIDSNKRYSGRIYEKITEKERRELRYPKSVFTIEKNGDKITMVPMSQVMEFSEEKYGASTMHKPFSLSEISEEDQTRDNLTKNGCMIPSSKQDKVLMSKDEALSIIRSSKSKDVQHSDLVVAVSSSILDEPVPSTLPEVPELFRYKSDLIDLHSVIENPSSPVLTKSGNTNLLNRVLYIEVLKMVEALQVGRSD